MGKPKIDRERSENNRQTFKVVNVSEWVQKLRTEWNQHTYVLKSDRLIKMIKNTILKAAGTWYVQGNVEEAV